jgi:hypothetical protein
VRSRFPTLVSSLRPSRGWSAVGVQEGTACPVGGVPPRLRSVFVVDLVSLVGRQVEDADVRKAIDEYRMTRCEDDELLDPGTVTYENPDVGAELRVDGAGTVTTVWLSAPGRGGASGYPGPLPGGLSFRSSRADARAALGGPTSPKESWDRWDREHVCIHLTYTADRDGIHSVTAMSPATAP